MKLTILHTNDLHGALTPEKAARIREIKAAAENPILLDSGDCIKAGNLAVPLKPEKAWRLLAEAGCDAGTIGNRESHILEPAFLAKLAGARHPLIVANLRKKDGPRPLEGSVALERFGLRIGLVGVMVPMVTERMALQSASAYLWDLPIPAARALAEALRPRVDCLIALTHIGLAQDRDLAEACPLFDLILGGHSHTVLEQPLRIGQTSICQGGSHGKFVGRYVWEKGTGLVESGLIPL